MEPDDAPARPAPFVYRPPTNEQLITQRMRLAIRNWEIGRKQAAIDVVEQTIDDVGGDYAMRLGGSLNQFAQNHGAIPPHFAADYTRLLNASLQQIQDTENIEHFMGNMDTSQPFPYDLVTQVIADTMQVNWKRELEQWRVRTATDPAEQAFRTVQVQLDMDALELDMRNFPEDYVNDKKAA